MFRAGETINNIQHKMSLPKLRFNLLLRTTHTSTTVNLSIVMVARKSLPVVINNTSFTLFALTRK